MKCVRDVRARNNAACCSEPMDDLADADADRRPGKVRSIVDVRDLLFVIYLQRERDTLGFAGIFCV